MGSTSISKKNVNMVAIQCSNNDKFDCNVDVKQLQELLTLLVDCKYKSVGCIVNHYLKDIKQHEEQCLHRTVRCLNDACEDIMAKDLLEHRNKHHSADCISTEENHFSLPIDLKGDVQFSKMVTIGEEIVLCRLKREDKKLQVSLIFVKTTHPHFNYKIYLTADDMKSKKHKFSISNIASGFNEDIDVSVEFDVEKLMQVCNIFTTSVRVKRALIQQGNIRQDQQFFEKLLCCWCGDFLTDSYYNCSTNSSTHNYPTCTTCYQDIKRKCLCSYTLQYITSLFKPLNSYEFQCPYQSLGCKQFIPRFTSNHELLCPFKGFVCAFDNSKFNTYSGFIAHLQENHTDNIINSNIYNIADINRKTIYMFAFGSVFLCKIVDARTFTIEWISTSVVSHNFIFEATFLGGGRRVTLITNTDPRELSYKINYYKSIYNIIKKTASFNISATEMANVDKCSLNIYKK